MNVCRPSFITKQRTDMEPVLPAPSPLSMLSNQSQTQQKAFHTHTHTRCCWIASGPSPSRRALCLERSTLSGAGRSLPRSSQDAWGAMLPWLGPCSGSPFQPVGSSSGHPQPLVLRQLAVFSATRNKIAHCLTDCQRTKPFGNAKTAGPQC